MDPADNERYRKYMVDVNNARMFRQRGFVRRIFDNIFDWKDSHRPAHAAATYCAAC